MYDFRDYLNHSEKLVFLAEELSEKDQENDWLLISATILAWAAIESFVNNRIDDFENLPDPLLQIHEKAFLLDKKIKFVNSGDKKGKFIIEGVEYNRIEDKIFLLLEKFGENRTSNISKGGLLWQEFSNFKAARDGLIHPRQRNQILLNLTKVQGFVFTSKKIINLISENIWRKSIVF
jgi:hypothetical protein